MNAFSRSTILALLGLALAFQSLSAQEPKTRAAKWERDIQAFEASDRIHPPPKGGILFIGSSSIRLWKTLAQDFPDQKVINRGFGGSEIVDSVQFAERIVFPYEPKRIVFFAGGNDINAGKSPEQVFEDFKCFVGKVQGRLPEVRIAYISITPAPVRWAQVEKIKALNALVEQYARERPKLTFIDAFPFILNAEGQPREELFVKDRLHLNEKGYALWTSLVRPWLTN